MRFSHFVVLAGSLFVTGCSSMVITPLMNGPKSCPAHIANLTYQNQQSLSHLREGLSKESSTMLFSAAPEKVKVYPLTDGGVVETYFYRIRQPDTCKYAERLSYNYTPVFFVNGKYVGQGYAYYYSQVKPYKIMPQVAKASVVSTQWLGEF